MIVIVIIIGFYFYFRELEMFELFCFLIILINICHLFISNCSSIFIGKDIINVLSQGLFPFLYHYLSISILTRVSTHSTFYLLLYSSLVIWISFWAALIQCTLQSDPKHSQKQFICWSYYLLICSIVKSTHNLHFPAFISTNSWYLLQVPIFVLIYVLWRMREGT